MGFPGMLGQKVRNNSNKTFFNSSLCKFDPIQCYIDVTPSVGGNGSKGRAWNIRKQRTHRPTWKERQAGMWDILVKRPVFKQDHRELQ